MEQKPANVVLCVHGADNHYENFHNCWRKAIMHHVNSTERESYEFVGLRWNERYTTRDADATNSDPVADCSDERFPEGWIDADAEEAQTDVLLYMNLLDRTFSAECDHCMFRRN